MFNIFVVLLRPVFTNKFESIYAFFFQLYSGLKTLFAESAYVLSYTHNLLTKIIYKIKTWLLISPQKQ